MTTHTTTVSPQQASSEDSSSPDRPEVRGWKRVAKFTAGAGAIWLTVELIAAIAIALWFTL